MNEPAHTVNIGQAPRRRKPEDSARQQQPRFAATTQFVTGPSRLVRTKTQHAGRQRQIRGVSGLLCRHQISKGDRCRAQSQPGWTSTRTLRIRAPACRAASPEGERSDALALRDARAPTPSWPTGVKELLPDEVIDELLSGASTEQDITGQGGLLGQLTKRMVERAMEVELTEHLGYETHVEPPGGAGNTRNGSTPKRLITEHGEVQINTPRDRDDSFEPRIVKKRQRRFEGFDDKILARSNASASPSTIERSNRSTPSEVTPRPSLLKQTESRRLVGQCTGRARLATWGGSVGPAAA
jgi:hypothetical protein